MTGAELRDLRRNLNLNQEQLAASLNVSKSYVQKIESTYGSLPSLIAERAFTLKRSSEARPAGELQARRQRHFHDFHRSTRFSKVPRFSDLPSCRCGDSGCHLTPRRDGEWKDGVRWWKFLGMRCGKISYVSERGQFLTPPPRYAGDTVPQRKCGKCGQPQALAKKFSVRLERDVYTRYCRRKKGDPRDQQHDPPTRFVFENKRFRHTSELEEEKLRGRSRRAFSVPKCDGENCPRKARTMERSTVLRLKAANGESVRIAVYRCRPPKGHAPHAAYRVLPDGFSAERSGLGLYRWIGANGASHETQRRRRPVRKNRIMPAVDCPTHECRLTYSRGPWLVGMKDLRGKRNRGERLSARMRRWRAICPQGGEFYYVRSDRTIRGERGSRWAKARSTGPSKETLAQIERAAPFEKLGITDRKRAPFVMVGDHTDPYAHYRVFNHRYGTSVEKAAAGLSEAEARVQVKKISGQDADDLLA